MAQFLAQTKNWLPAICLALSLDAGAQPVPGIFHLDTSIENASPLWYEAASNNTVLVHLLYDHEYASSNRAAGHVHFLIHGEPGTKFRLELTNLDNIYNGKPGSVSKELKTLVVSTNAREWKPVSTTLLPENRVCVDLEMPGPLLYVARMQPYGLSDLERFLSEIRRSPRAKISVIGRTIEGRPLEIVQIGNPQAPWRVFIRARAHPWESGGNWVAEGLIRRLLKGDAESKKFLQCYCLYVMPMANKDGVAHGRTRFNLKGKDLNRDWMQPANASLAPENAALEAWLEKMIREGRRPHLALEMHNDGYGKLHITSGNTPQNQRYIEKMNELEKLLRRHTWFTEGVSIRPPVGTLADGWVGRFGIDAIVHELNANWIAGLNDYPSARHWMDYGSNLARVFYEYFSSLKP